MFENNFWGNVKGKREKEKNARFYMRVGIVFICVFELQIQW